MLGDVVFRRQLTESEIAQKVHRELVGGMWDEIGTLQFVFLRDHGLEPSQRLLDVGCGALRGGFTSFDIWNREITSG